MIAVLALFLSMTSGDTISFTVEEAIDFALENNPEISQLNIEFRKSREQVGQAVSALYPTITATGYYAYVTDIPVIEFDSIPIPFGSNENYNVKVSLQQVLFAWGKLYNTFKISDLASEIAEMNLVRKQQEIRYSVTDAFYGLLVLDEYVKQARASLAQLEKFAASVETRFKAGLVSQFDLLRAQVQVQNLRPAVIESENALNLAREGFRLLLGMELDSEFMLTGELQMIDEEFALDELIADALQNRAEVKNLKKAEKIALLSRAVARRANLPTLIGGATYDRSKPFGITGDEWGSNITFNLGFQWTLFSGFSNLYKSREAALMLKEARLAMDNLDRAITVEVKQAYLSFLAAKEAIDAAEKNVGQAKKAFEIIETRYKSGLATSLEVLDTELAYRQAQVNYLSALKNYNTSLAQIYKAIGKED
ncbi:MAG: TolC family protein [candidate division WOR-3 bacterium]|nr:MAG: TolC family protein [candidate division WOR-3 bacterium]